MAVARFLHCSRPRNDDTNMSLLGSSAHTRRCREANSLQIEGLGIRGPGAISSRFDMIGSGCLSFADNLEVLLVRLRLRDLVTNTSLELHSLESVGLFSQCLFSSMLVVCQQVRTSTTSGLHWLHPWHAVNYVGSWVSPSSSATTTTTSEVLEVMQRECLSCDQKWSWRERRVSLLTFRTVFRV